MDGLLVPPSFRDEPRWAHERPDALAWLDGLEATAHRTIDAWQLTVDGPSRHGSNGIAIPVSAAEGPAVLKLQQPGPDLERQSAALREWAGRGTVALLRADSGAGTLLLERLADTPPFTALSVEEALTELGRLLRRQAVRTTTALPGTTAYAGWVRHTLAERSVTAGRPWGRTLLAAVSRAADLVADPGTQPDLLVNADLHPGQVMWRAGEGWCAVDPRPMRGAPEYQCAQLLWTSADRLPDAASLRRGLGIVVEAAGLEPVTARAWALVRSADYLLWGLGSGLTEDPVRCRRIIDALASG